MFTQHRKTISHTKSTNVAGGPLRLNVKPAGNCSTLCTQTLLHSQSIQLYRTLMGWCHHQLSFLGSVANVYLGYAYVRNYDVVVPDLMAFLLAQSGTPLMGWTLSL